MEARVSPEERECIERAASVAGLSVSAFMVGAAVERAGEVIAEATTTTPPPDYFDELLAALDDWLVRHTRPATGQCTRTYVLIDTDVVVDARDR